VCPQNWLVFACSGVLFPDCPLVVAVRSPPPAPTLQHGDAQPLLPATSNTSPNAWERGWTPSTHPERPASPTSLRYSQCTYTGYRAKIRIYIKNIIHCSPLQSIKSPPISHKVFSSSRINYATRTLQMRCGLRS
jgi:hypothetical protein